MKAVLFALALTASLLTLMGCGHYAVSYSPTPLTIGDKAAAPKAETTESAASTERGS